MQHTNRRFSAFLLALLLLFVMSPAMAENDILEIAVPNTPIKGIIQLEKIGPVLTGFTAHQDAFGNTVHTPVFTTGWMEGAVFEVRAVEDIVGKDGMFWFKAYELADTIVTTGERIDQTRPLPLGHYYVTEVSAPGGYVFDSARYDVLLEAKDQKTPVVTASIMATNEFMPTRISLVKEKEITATLTDDNGMIHTQLVNVPGEGFVFGLFNSREISYAGGTLPAGSLIATAISDKKGTVSFYGQFPAGEYDLREIACPEGWQLDPASRGINIPDDAHVTGEEMIINLNTPIVNHLIYHDVRISKTDLTGSDYLPHTMIEITNEAGKIVLRDYTGEDGYLPPFPAVPGVYTYREVLAPEGYELSVTELTFRITEDGQVEGQTTVTDDYTRFSVRKENDRRQALAGVEFGLFREDGSLVATAITNHKGLATFEKIPYGRYEIRETKALPGYLKNHTAVPITIDGTFVNPTEPLAVLTNRQIELLIKKTDQNGAALPGAEFGLYDENGKLVMTAVSDMEGMVRFIGVEYGKYAIREIAAPEGYMISHDMINMTVDEDYVNSDKPIADVKNQRKKIMCIKSDPSGKPIPGVAFALYNAATMEKVETAVSDANGVFTFQKFSYGDWIIRETEAPAGYSRMEDIRFHVGEDWTEPKPILCVNIPDHYEFMKVNSDGEPLEGVKFRLEDESGNELGTYESDKDGMVSITGLKPGTYIIREIETLDGYTVTGEVIQVKLDEYYTIPVEMRKLVNYTTIQTGVQMAVTGIMWIGIGIMAASGTIGLIRRRRNRKTK